MAELEEALLPMVTPEARGMMEVLFLKYITCVKPCVELM